MTFKEFRERYEKKKIAEEPNTVTQKPLVSILVQTYQHSGYIKECLESLLMQEVNFDYEILLGEDASNDGTREICIEYAQRYPDKIRLFLHHRENNIKIGGRPTGRFILMYNLYSARGEYIALCEGDDYWSDPLKLQKQVDFMEKESDYVITYHDAKIIDENGNLLKERKLSQGERMDMSRSELTKNPYILTLTACFKNVMLNFPAEFYGVTNADTFLFSLLGQFGKGKYMDSIEPAHYRVHSGGIWSAKKKIEQKLASYNTFKRLSLYYGRVGDRETAVYFKKKSTAKFIAAIEKSSFFSNFRTITNAFLKEGKFASYIWFLLSKISLVVFKKEFFLKNKLHRSLSK